MRTYLLPVLGLTATMLVDSTVGSDVAQDGPTVHVAVGSSLVTVVGQSPLPAGLEVLRSGALVGTGTPRPTIDGEISYAISWTSEPRRLEPGDAVVYSGVEPPLEVSLPEVRADIDEGAGRVVGLAPIGAALELSAEYHDIDGAVRQHKAAFSSPSDGRFAVALPDAAPESGDGGVVVLRDEEGNEFASPFAVFSGQVTLAEPALSFASALGQPARIEHSTRAGQAPFRRDVVTGGGTDEAALDVTRLMLAAPVAAGDLITVTRERPLLNQSGTAALRVPVLEVGLLADADEVIGRAPPNVRVTVHVRAPDGTLCTRDATSGSGGRVRVGFAGELDIDRGWQATLEVDLPGGWRVRAASTLSLVHVELDAAIVKGEAGPLSPVVVTALDEAGRETHRWDTVAWGDGRFSVRLTIAGDPRDGEVLDLQPGDILGVDLTDGGDPTLFVVPELTAAADIDGERIVGSATPGHQVDVEVRGTNDVLARSGRAPVAPSGAYAVSLAGLHDIEPGAFGRVILSRADGHQWSVPWVARRTTLDLDSGQLWTVAPTNRPAWVRLLDPSGAERGTVRWRTRLVSDWSRRVTEIQSLHDRFGRDVTPRAGDVVEGEIGADTFRFTVPRVEAAAHLARDEVSGSTDAAPGTLLRLQVRDGDTGRIERTSIVPPDGAFLFDLGQPQGQEQEAFDLRHNATVTLRLENRADRFTRIVTVPGLQLDLTGPRLSGSLAPASSGTVTWSRAGRVLGDVDLVAAADGSYAVELRTGDGAPFSLQEGDKLALIGLQPGFEEPLTLTLPRLDLELDLAENALDGRVSRPAGSRFTLETDRRNVVEGALGGGRWTEHVTWLDDERFSIDFDDHPVSDGMGGQAVFTLVSGAVAEAALRMPDGHLVRRWRLVPMLHVQHGGQTVCGEGEPDAATRIVLQDAQGRTMAEASPQASADGRFMARFADGDAPLRIVSGSRLDATIGGHALGMTVPRMELAFDWLALTMTLRGLPQHRYQVWYPAESRDCWGGFLESESDAPSTDVASIEQTTDAQGFLAHDASYLANREASPDRGLLVQTIEPGLQRVYALVYGTRAEIHLGTAFVLGRSSPFTQLAARVVSGGSPIGSGSTTADGTGAFALMLERPDEEVRLASGQTLHVEGQGETIRLDLPPLDFDFDTANGVVGVASAHARVALTLRLRDGRALTTRMASDDRGRFRFGADDVPDSEDWSLEEVATIRAAHQFRGPHLVVRDMLDATGAPPSATPAVPTGTPTPDPALRSAIYLPSAHLGR